MNTFINSPGKPQVNQDSRRVAVRPLQPDDAGALYELHRRLLPDSLYSRFLQYRWPTLDEMAAICALAPAKGAGFVAISQDGRARVVGLAYYVRDGAAAPASAELAIIVADQYQGLGVGRALWQRLHEQAATERLHELRVLFAAHNQRILRLIAGGGYHYECCHAAYTAGDLNDYRIRLAAPQDSSRIRRLLTRAVAHVF